MCKPVKAINAWVRSVFGNVNQLTSFRTLTMCSDKRHFCIFSFLDCPSMQFRLKSGSSAGEILPPFKLPRDLPLALSATRQTPLLGGKLIASRLGKLKTWKTQGFENQTWKTQQSHNYTVERLKNLS